MDSSVSSLVSTLGGGSGVDMVKLASDLAAARFAPQIAQLEARNDALDARISAASTLRNQLSQLASALGDRIRNGDLAPAATISNPGVAQVGVPAGSSPRGTYALEVTQLAKQQVLALPPFAAPGDAVGEGSFTLRFGTVDGAAFTPDGGRAQVDIAVTASDTPETLAGKINSADAGVRAYVVTGSLGAQLVLKGAEGAANGFVVETASAAPVPAATPGDLAYLAWHPGNDSGQIRQGAQDAAFTFDTIAMTSPGNAVSGLPDGLSLTLTGTNAGAPASIGFADRSAGIKAVMNDFVAALNDIGNQLKESAAPLGGELGNDPGARALKRALSGLSGQIVMPNAGPGEPATLSALGLSVNRDGTFRLDAARLEETLDQHREGAAAMFTTGLFGIYATIDDLARTISSSADPGSLGGSIQRYSDQKARVDERLQTIADQQEQLRERMTKTFIAADRNIALSQSTLSFLKAQVAAWNAQGN